jgi:hypothetical protein
LANRVTWPDGKAFAFTIFDDTDYATMDNVPEVYAFLADLGFRTTKTVWPVESEGAALCRGATCEDEVYLEWVRGLQARGFEIAWHMASYSGSSRGQTIQALDRFKHLFGSYPRSMANHSGCVENIYWGDARLSGLNRLSYDVLTAMKFHQRYKGHVEGSEYFWGDVCKERIEYVRNFVFGDINTLKAVPFMPYHDPHRPFVNQWFAASEGPEFRSFIECIKEAEQDRLEEEGGACIMYTHLACGFYRDGEIDTRFRQVMERLSRRNGWFVPVSGLLDYLRKINGEHVITDDERTRLERRWLKHKLMVGRS